MARQPGKRSTRNRCRADLVYLVCLVRTFLQGKPEANIPIAPDQGVVGAKIVAKS